MPIFEYRCNKCGDKFEELVQGDRSRAVPCPQCGALETEKQMSAIGGIAMGGSKNTPCGTSGCSGSTPCCSSGNCPHAG